jgi:hypothetical protein
MTAPNPDPDPGNQQARTLAPCETSFRAFLEYRSVVLGPRLHPLHDGRPYRPDGGVAAVNLPGPAGVFAAFFAGGHQAEPGEVEPDPDEPAPYALTPEGEAVPDAADPEPEAGP